MVAESGGVPRDAPAGLLFNKYGQWTTITEGDCGEGGMGTGDQVNHMGSLLWGESTICDGKSLGKKKG
jgi:hypothetical protein